MLTDDWIATAILNVAELSDRNSPNDQPEMMLVTGPELRACIERAIEEHTESQPVAEQLQAVVDELVAADDDFVAAQDERDGESPEDYDARMNAAMDRIRAANEAARRLRSATPKEPT